MESGGFPLGSGSDSSCLPDGRPAGSLKARRLDREKGDLRPGPLGGERRTGRIEAQAERVPGLLAETPDITVEELRAALAARGHAFGYGTQQRFFARRRITRKERPRTPASRTAPIS